MSNNTNNTNNPNPRTSNRSTQRHSTSTDRLPRLHSHTRLKLPSEPLQPTPTTNTEKPHLIRPRSHSDLQSARQALQSANTSKTVRLQATQIVYLKKIEQLEKQEYILGREIGKVKGEIEELRVKRKGGEDGNGSNGVGVGGSSRCLSTVSGGSGSTGLRGIGSAGNSSLNGRMESLRKKIDKQTEKLRKTMTELNQTRKQITTVKHINTDLLTQLSSCTQSYTAQQTKSHELQLKLTSLTEQIKKKRVEEAKGRAQMVREYDGILRRLEEELGGGKGSNGRGQGGYGQFYITDLPNATHANYQQTTKKPNPGNSTSKAQSTAALIKTQLQLWQTQLSHLQTSQNTTSLPQLTALIESQQTDHFHKVKYLSDRHQHLMELQARNQELRMRKQQMGGFVDGESRGKKQKEEIMEKIGKCEIAEKKMNEEVERIAEMYRKLKKFAETFAERTGKVLSIQGEITEANLGQWLQAILQVSVKPSTSRTSNHSNANMSRVSQQRKKDSHISSVVTE